MALTYLNKTADTRRTFNIQGSKPHNVSKEYKGLQFTSYYFLHKC